MAYSVISWPLPRFCCRTYFSLLRISALSHWDDPDLCLSSHEAQVQNAPPYCELKRFSCGLDVEGGQAGYKNVGSCLLSVMFLMLFIAYCIWASLVAQFREGNGTPLQYSCLENPWTEEPGRLQSMGSRRVGHD